MKDEIWKNIEGYEGYYQISSYGRVKGLERDIYNCTTNEFMGHRKECIKTLFENKDGYYTVKLSKDGKDVRYFVQRLVATAFIGPCPSPEYEVNHIDTNRKNNYYENLEWVTHKDNVKHSANLGHYQRFRERNSNFNNDTLHNKVKDNPELRIQYYSRPGNQNGRARSVSAYDLNNNILGTFSYITECAEWIIEKLNLKSKPSSMIAKISNAAKNDTVYKNMKFKFN